MLLGIWKNIEELEESINLDELRVILKASNEREMRHNRFMAAIQGIDIDKDDEAESQEAFERAQRRAEARLSGRSENEIEFDEFGLDIEIEE